MPRFEYSVTVCLREIELRIAVAIAQLRSRGTSQRGAARSAATAIRAGALLPGGETERAAAIAALPQRSREVIVSLMLAGLSLVERVAKMRRDEVRSAILAETDIDDGGTDVNATLLTALGMALPLLFSLAAPVNSYPTLVQSIFARAPSSGRDPS